ncbi:Hypothetical Protein sle_16490 [Streptomyces leeuwenhoekii]|uniref:Uncharacterized protein n=1 Tax=Streptomyces leeuwenhoekii TaxID=1437453 RepID=A0A0F7VVY4_STRLW|nr:Hypothetical Protein sle_16490 [Streptomyces leeuwenhoekii]
MQRTRSLHRSGPRTLLTSVVALLSLLTALLIPLSTAASARATESGSLPMVTCTGSATQHYSPALVAATRLTTVTSTQNYGTCVDVQVDPDGPPVTSASSFVTFTAPLSCLLSPPVLEVELIIHWNGGRTSTAQALAVVSRTTGTTIATDTGTITSGLFAGKTINVTVVYPTLDVTGCLLGDGVSEISGAATLVVAPV